ncbi:MAG: hypothetical protein AAF288_06500 [Planctomycetota bacterium]
MVWPIGFGMSQHGRGAGRGTGVEHLLGETAAPPTSDDALEAAAEGPRFEPPPSVNTEDRERSAKLLSWLVAITLYAVVISAAVLITFQTVTEPPPTDRTIPRLSTFDPPDLALPTDAPIDRPLTEAQEVPAPEPLPIEAPPIETPAPPDAPLPVVVIPDTAAPAGLASDNPLTAAGAATVQFFGAEAQARKIVFVVDASGSMADTLDFVLKELIRSVNDLEPSQEFTVIFFSGRVRNGQAASVLQEPPGRKGLGSHARASSQRKGQVEAWVEPEARNIQPARRGDPAAAIQQALAYRPDMVILLSDNITGSGQYERNQQDLLNAVRQANGPIGASIHTLQFLYPDTLVQAGGRGTLELLAEQNGGSYRFVSAEQLGLARPE